MTNPFKNWMRRELLGERPTENPIPADGKIEVKLVRTNMRMRWPCTVCGGETDKEGVLAEGPGGIIVCALCLKAGDIDTRLAQHAAGLERKAAHVRSLIGRLSVPTFAEWMAGHDRCEAEEEAAYVEADQREAEALGCTVEELHRGAFAYRQQRMKQ